MTIVTLYALFGDDIKIAVFTKSEDVVFNYITTFALVIFTIEITINALVQDNYFNSFYFWLDIVSTISLITDISWIWDSIVGVQDDYSASNAEQAGQLARAGRGARIGTRAGRITRVIRLVRLIRIGRLWKHANNRLNRRGKYDDEFSTLLRQQRTINLLKQQK
jgi:class 3 adenylate cyclase